MDISLDMRPRFVDNHRMMIYENLKQYLEDKQISRRRLAKQLGISSSYMAMLVNGERRPSPELAARIERLTGIPFRVLLLTEEPSKSAA